MKESCLPARRLVARGSFCTVEECSCGILHVTLGVFTVRLQPEVVMSVWQTLGEALARLSNDAPERPRSPARSPERPS